MGKTKADAEESTMNIEIKEVRELESADKNPSIAKALMHIGDGLCAIACALNRPRTFPTDDKIDLWINRNA